MRRLIGVGHCAANLEVNNCIRLLQIRLENSAEETSTTPGSKCRAAGLTLPLLCATECIRTTWKVARWSIRIGL